MQSKSKMPDKPFLTYAPFGIATKRFTKMGFHPELDKSGAMKREITKLGPGSFNAKRPLCQSKQGMSWKRKLELEEFSKFLGFRNASVLRARQFAKTLRGPGSAEINEELFRKQVSSQKQNTGFGSGPNIGKSIWGLEAPPPDTYYRNISERFEPTNKTFSKLPTFEFDGIADRFKSDIKTYHLPCNLYNLNDKKNMADIIKKVVSDRGPYDCFTGPRDSTTIKGYFIKSKEIGPEYFYIKPSDLDHILTHPSKKRCGVFLKSARVGKKPTERHILNDLSLCYRDPNQPGPAHYDLSNSCGIKKIPSTKHPFDSSNVNCRPPVDWRISPGPGRYNPKAPRCMKLKKPSWVFLTTGDRSLFKVPKYSVYY